jgi:hypothetical protein
MNRAIRNLRYSIGFDVEEISQILAPTNEETARLQAAKESLIAEVEAFLHRSRSETQPHLVIEEARQPSLAEMVESLQVILGPRLTALVAGTKDAREIINWASSEVLPNSEIEQRLRGAFEIVQLLLKVESPSAVRSWFLGMNPELDDRAPALVFADEPEVVAEAARNFVAAG